MPLIKIVGVFRVFLIIAIDQIVEIGKQNTLELFWFFYFENKKKLNSFEKTI